ncbi:MAG: hypothetical protein HY290_06375 [Planctomycetia bacterium]|nr:hypothetical protein [Planctomycetia bacterium]
MKLLPDIAPPLSFQFVAELAIAAIVVLILLRLLAGPAATISRRAGLYVVRGLILLAVLALLFNPVRIQELPGSIDAPDVFYLLDASTSMAMGTGATRWDDVTAMIRAAHDKAGTRSHARLNLFRFGQKLSAIEPAQIGMAPSDVPAAGGKAAKTPPPAKPGDSDTQLAGALRQISSRFGRSPPASIVLFSDGQARDAADVEKIAGSFARLKVPIHVVPVGDTTRGGDVAIVGVVAPDRVRRFSQVDVQVFLRSFGYEGQNARLVLSSLGENGLQHEITSTPITLRKGIQSVPLAFQSEAQMRKLEVSISPQSDEISTANNRFPIEISIDRTKIRVLYAEGNGTRTQQVVRNGRVEQRGPFSELQEALSEDPDIECVVLMSLPGATDLRRIANANVGGAYDRGFPDTVAELSAFDCIILSNVSRAAISEKHLKWIENWVNQRGGGLCMTGGQFSFGSGGWGGSVVEQILPVALRESAEDFEYGSPIVVQAMLSGRVHPIWHIVNDDKQNRDIIRSFPPFSAGNQLPNAKPNIATVLATAPRAQGGDLPVITVGHYGKGRSMALAGGITEPWSGEFTRWGQEDHRYYAKFWRNAVYWLTESSSIGRRRLIASTDKKSYRPGDTIALAALAYDEGANRTRDYRIVAMIEPAASTTELNSDDSPVRWPDGLQRTSGQEGPFIAWGEEFELAKAPGKEGYDIQLPIAEALAAANQALRIELTAYEDLTQVDSTSLNVQVLDDPFELQNPFPNHELMSRIAAVSGGKVLSTADELARELEGIPVKVGPSTTRTTPLWSRWEILIVLVGLLTAEWIWRRKLGLA